MKTVLFDMDGVLADFVLGFTKLIHEFDPSFPVVPTGKTLDWGMSDVPSKLKDKAWRKVKSTPWWWWSLSPLVTQETFKRIRRLANENRIYFVTSREEGTPHVLRQTQLWLSEQGINGPSVVVTERKGEFAALVGADFAIDDKPENAASFFRLGSGCKSYFINNNNLKLKAANDFLPEQVKWVFTVDDYLDDIEKEIR